MTDSVDPGAGVPADANPFAPPRAALLDPVEPDLAGGLVLGSRWARLGAALLDGLFGALLFWPVAWWRFGHLPAPDAHTEISANAVWFEAVMNGSLWAYGPVVVVQGLLLWRGGHTLGKKLLGLRVVRTDGSRAGFPRLFLARGGFSVVVWMIPLLGPLVGLVDLLMIFGARRRCLHDLVADTVVVTSSSSRGATLAAVRAAAGAVTPSA